MENNKTINAETAKNANSKKAEVKTTASTPTYDPDDYMYEYIYYDDTFYNDEKCLSCRYWLGYDCGIHSGQCSYEPL